MGRLQPTNWVDCNGPGDRLSPAANSGIIFEMLAWKDSSGAEHVITILLPKGFAHHALLARRANKIHERKRHKCVPAGQPVLQEEPLRQTPDPDRRIHGMTNRAERM